MRRRSLDVRVGLTSTPVVLMLDRMPDSPLAAVAERSNPALN